MDTNTIVKIRLYRDCSQLPMQNFDMIRSSGNLEWLVYGYDGWGEIDIPEDAEDVWGNILNEYAELTENNTSLYYFELLAEISDIQTRITVAGALLYGLESRWQKMNNETKKEYIEQLKDWRFYFNSALNPADEFERLHGQLKAVDMKLKIKESEQKDFETAQGKGGGDLIKVKAKIQRVIKMRIDLKLTSVKEWLAIVEDAISISKVK